MEPPPKAPRTMKHVSGTGTDLLNTNTRSVDITEIPSASSTPGGSPSLPRSRLGKVTRLLSRSDANIPNVRVSGVGVTRPVHVI